MDGVNPTNDVGGLDVDALIRFLVADGPDKSGHVRLPMVTVLRLAAEAARFREVRRARVDGRADTVHDARCGPDHKPWRKDNAVRADDDIPCDCGAQDIVELLEKPIEAPVVAPTPRELAAMTGQADAAE